MRLFTRPIRTKRVYNYDFRQCNIKINADAQFVSGIFGSGENRIPLLFIISSHSIICYDIERCSSYMINWPQSHVFDDGTGISDFSANCCNKYLVILFRNNINEKVYGSIRIPDEITKESLTHLSDNWHCYKLTNTTTLIDMTAFALQLNQNNSPWMHLGIVNNKLYQINLLGLNKKKLKNPQKIQKYLLQEYKQNINDKMLFVRCQKKYTKNFHLTPDLKFPDLHLGEVYQGHWAVFPELRKAILICTQQNVIFSINLDDLITKGVDEKHPIQFNHFKLPDNLPDEMRIFYHPKYIDEMEEKYPLQIYLDSNERLRKMNESNTIVTVVEFQNKLAKSDILPKNDNINFYNSSMTTFDDNNKIMAILPINNDRMHFHQYKFPIAKYFIKLVPVLHSIVIIFDLFNFIWLCMDILNPSIIYDITSYNLCETNEFHPDEIIWNPVTYNLIFIRFGLYDNNDEEEKKWNKDNYLNGIGKYQKSIHIFDVLPSDIVIYQQSVKRFKIMMLTIGFVRNDHTCFVSNLLEYIASYVDPFIITSI